MDTKDIYVIVGEKMQEDGFTNLPFMVSMSREEKSQAIASMNQALAEYSYEKLCEVTTLDAVIMDLGVLLDTIDSYLPEEQKESFFEHYVHCMINVYSSLENKGVLWNIEDSPAESSPRFNQEGEYLEFFTTPLYSKNKENALWINHYLSTKYSCKQVKK